MYRRATPWVIWELCQALALQYPNLNEADEDFSGFESFIKSFELPFILSIGLIPPYYQVDHLFGWSQFRA